MNHINIIIRIYLFLNTYVNALAFQYWYRLSSSKQHTGFGGYSLMMSESKLADSFECQTASHHESWINLLHNLIGKHGTC